MQSGCVGMMLELHDRKPLTTTQRVQLFRDHKGMCCICGGKINVGETWHDDHQRALALGGTNDLSNRGPSHVDCHKEKTKDDVAMIAKAKRNEARHFGAETKRPWPKRGEWKDNTKYLDQL